MIILIPNTVLDILDGLFLFANYRCISFMFHFPLILLYVLFLSIVKNSMDDKFKYCGFVNIYTRNGAY